MINIVRQMSIVGLIALGVTGIIVSAGIDLSSGSVVGLTAVVAASLAQSPDNAAAFYPGLHLPLIVPVVAACLVGALVGLDQWHSRCESPHSPFHRYFGYLHGDSRCRQPLYQRSSDLRFDG